MYATCLFCAAALGRNATLEPFPVGRRLAYDAARGRLWVVCPSCARWNLTPLDARWEAIEGAERLYRDTRQRVSTGNIGLARVGDGLELVRIGAPQRPEFAAWRYGDQFGTRRRRAMVVGAAAVGLGTAAGVGAAFVGATVIGAGAFGTFMAGRLAYGAVHGWLTGARGARAAHLTLHATGRRVHVVSRDDVARTTIARDAEGAPALRVSLGPEYRLVTGAEAQAVMARLLPIANGSGAGKDGVRSAVRRLESAGSPEAILRAAARTAPRWTPAYRRRYWHETTTPDDEFTLPMLAPSTRLALEMALHEEQERRAMEGELAVLEQAWREAEEIAAIADDLTLPAGVLSRLAKLKRTNDHDAAG